MLANPRRPSERALRRHAALLLATALACALPAEARAQTSGFEIGPWLGWAAGPEWQHGRQRDVFSLNAGLDVTADLWRLGGGYGGAVEVRMGPYAALQIPLDRKASGEGGLTMIFTQAHHASWGTYGLRLGAAYGGDRETDLVATLWGGVRYVLERTGQGSGGTFAKATGVRIVATYRETIDPVKATALVFGIEFEPDYFLPPYSLFKWGGKH
jgi:hypothetical protein